ncbi:MAG: DUF6600 domain-containing protein [Polyangiaceae bacterium]
MNRIPRSFVPFVLLGSAWLVGCGGAATPSPDYPHAGGTPVGESEPAAAEEGQATTFGVGDEVLIGAEPGSAVPASSTATAVTDSDTYFEDTDPSALTEFHDVLAPYGQWTEDATYGTVWYPSSSIVGSDFTPYVTAGHWTYADDYTWVSDYGWGWAPFHYGRWVYVAGHGWAWIPGRRYAGAWVTWRVGYDPAFGYVGWAPLAPTWYWRNGFAYGIYNVPPVAYSFCPTHAVFDRNVGHHVATGPGVGAIASRTRPYEPARPQVTADGRVPARPVVNGPPPSDLRIDRGVVARTPASDPGISRALSVARNPSKVAALPNPSGAFDARRGRGRLDETAPLVSATPYSPRGAVPSTTLSPTSPQPFDRTRVATSPTFTDRNGAAFRSPYSTPPSSSTLAPQSRPVGRADFGTAPSAAAPRTSSPSMFDRPTATSPGRAASAPVFRPPTSSGPTFSSTPSFTSPSFSTGGRASFGGPSGAVSRPTVPSSPSFSSSSGGRASFGGSSGAVSRPSAPSFSAPSGGRASFGGSSGAVSSPPSGGSRGSSSVGRGRR